MTSHYSVLFRSPTKNARISEKKLVKLGRHIHTFRDLANFSTFFFFLGLDVGVSQEVKHSTIFDFREKNAFTSGFR